MSSSPFPHRQANSQSLPPPQLVSEPAVSAGSVEFAVNPGFNLRQANTKNGVAAWDKYCHRFNYTACNEDSQCELSALQLGPGKRVLSITAGGGRVLSLLAARPSEIWTVDVNIWQSHFLDLKLNAMRALEYEECLAFLGVNTSPHRLATYHRQVEPLLAPSSREFFCGRLRLIERGILLQGNLERYLCAISRGIGVIWRKNRDRLFSFNDPAAQRQFAEKKWDGRFARSVVQLVCRKKMIEWLMDDPGFTRFLPPGTSLHRRIHTVVGDYMKNNLVRQNSLLTMIFFGNYVFEESLPVYLQRKHFATIKETLKTARVRIITGLLEDVLKTVPGPYFDAYSISDIGSYMTDEVWNRHLDQVLRTARPGAKFCARHILGNRTLDLPHARRLLRDPALEERLTRHDHAMVHEFLVAQVQ